MNLVTPEARAKHESLFNKPASERKQVLKFWRQEFDYGTGKRVIIFQPFGDNRQGFAVRRRNDKNPFAKGTISFVDASNNKTLYEEKIDLTKYL
jgi:hypothetical protein